MKSWTIITKFKNDFCFRKIHNISVLALELNSNSISNHSLLLSGKESWLIPHAQTPHGHFNGRCGLCLRKLLTYNVHHTNMPWHNESTRPLA